MTRNDFMINHHVCYLAKLGLELAIPGFAVRRATDCAMEPGDRRCSVEREK